MRTTFTLSVLAVLLVVASSPSLAEMIIERVSKVRAKGLGMEIRAKASSPSNAWVELEFQAEGTLKDFDHVSLEIREGETFLLGYARLREKRSSSGKVVVGFMANRAYLDKVTLSAVTGHPMYFAGHELRLKDFVELEKLR